MYGSQGESTPKPAAPKKITVPHVISRKGQMPLVMVTAYDASSARIVDRAGVDMILVGDSLGMVVLGYEDTLRVDLEDMIRHTAAVRRTKPRALLVTDMPYMSYHTGSRDAVLAAGRLVREGGAEAVKLEGGHKRLEVIEALLNAEIPVMGHLGLTPQSLNAMGGYRVQGRVVAEIDRLIADARALENAGVFAMVLEGLPADVATMISNKVSIPTIGIGAGVGCDGQVLVYHDLLGLFEGSVPKFVKQYATLHETALDAIESFSREVRERRFPTARESYRLPRSVGEALGERRG